MVIFCGFSTDLTRDAVAHPPPKRPRTHEQSGRSFSINRSTCRTAVPV
jgi:hypothetical protein